MLYMCFYEWDRAGLDSTSRCALACIFLRKMYEAHTMTSRVKKGKERGKKTGTSGWEDGEETRDGGRGSIRKGKEERRGEDEGEREREKNHISFIKFGFKNHNETPRHVDKNHNASIPPSFYCSHVLNDAMLAPNSPYLPPPPIHFTHWLISWLFLPIANHAFSFEFFHSS